jgi:hypothetical protein
MALLECTTCGKKVSTEATACPKCGAPPPKSRIGESITPEQSAKMNYKERRAFQKAGGKILLSKTQKYVSIALGCLILFGVVKCSISNDSANDSSVSKNQIYLAEKQIEKAMKDPRKIRLLECEGINPWQTKPDGWTPPSSEECTEIKRVLSAEAEARKNN